MWNSYMEIAKNLLIWQSYFLVVLEQALSTPRQDTMLKCQRHFCASKVIQAEYYHAGREEHVRQEIEQKLVTNQYKVVCATNALGMGIDKPDLRFIIHYQIPGSPISYYQEIGRSGRDGKFAWCILLYDPADLHIQEHFIRTAKPERKCYEYILSLLRIVPQGLYDLMRATGYTQSIVENILIDLEGQGLIQHNRKARNYIVAQSLWTVPGIELSSN